MIEVYLGDSVYVEFDGHGLTLTTRNELPCDPSNTIYLEPETLEALNKYYTWVKKINEVHHKD